MQDRVDGCQLRSGRGSRTHTSSENRSNAGRWPSNESTGISSQNPGAEGPHTATLKVGRGPGTESPSSNDAAKPRPSGGGLGAEPPVSLDSYTHNRNSPESPQPTKLGRHCGRRTMLGTAASGERRFIRHRCKSYRCALCGPKKRRRLRARLSELAKHHGLDKMLTLTVDPARLPADADPITYIRSKVWRDMRVYLDRHFGRTVYIAILERHQSGVGHLHVLVSRFLPQQMISRFSGALGGGRVVHIQYVGVRNVAAYLSKYLAKEQELPPRVRHVTTSRGLPIWPEAHRKSTGAEFVWQLSRLPIEIFFAHALNARNETYEIEPDGTRVLSFFVAEGLAA